MTQSLDDPRLTPARSDLAAAHLRGRVRADRFVEGEPHTVIAAWTALRGEPDAAAAQTSELLFGEGFTVYEIRDGWAWGQATGDGYVGYTDAAALAAGAPAPTHQVTTLFAHLYPAPKLKTPATHCLPLAARLALGETSDCGRYRRVTGPPGVTGWIGAAQVGALEQAMPGYVELGERFLGAPYLWGGGTPAGLDCSALVQIPLRLAGFHVPRDSDLQRAAMRAGLGEPVPREQARRGDIAFFPGHVGIMLDSAIMLHANATHMAVTSNPLAEVIGWLADKHAEPFLGLYRLRGTGS